MPKAPKLTASLIKMIGDIHRKNPEWNGKEVLAELWKRTGSNDYPKLSVVQRELKTTKDNDEYYKNSRIAWSIGSMEHEENISAEALPYIQAVVKIAEYLFPLREKGEDERVIPIGQARWVAKLHKLVNDPRRLFIISFFYFHRTANASFWSHRSELRNTTNKVLLENVDTTDLDNAVVNDDMDYFQQFVTEKSPLMMLFYDIKNNNNFDYFLLYLKNTSPLVQIFASYEKRGKING